MVSVILIPIMHEEKILLRSKREEFKRKLWSIRQCGLNPYISDFCIKYAQPYAVQKIIENFRYK